MFKSINIQRVDGTDKATDLLANAATPYRFKQVFGVDLLSKFANAEKEIDGQKFYEVDFIPQLAFIMNMQASGQKTDQVNDDQFLSWVEQFESFSFEQVADEVVSVYVRNAESFSEAKKNSDRPSAK